MNFNLTILYLSQQAALTFISVYAIISVFEGSRRLCTNGRNTASIKMVFMGSLFCIGWSAINFTIAYTLEDLFSDVSIEETVTTLPDNWRDELPPFEREINSKTFASLHYQKYGTILDYFEASGTRQPFCPSSEEVVIRNESMETECQLKRVVISGYETAVLWIFYGLFSALLGWAVSFKKFRVQLGYNSE